MKTYKALSEPANYNSCLKHPHRQTTQSTSSLISTNIPTFNLCIMSTGSLMNSYYCDTVLQSSLPLQYICTSESLSSSPLVWPDLTQRSRSGGTVKLRLSLSPRLNTSVRTQHLHLALNHSPMKRFVTAVVESVVGIVTIIIYFCVIP